MLPQGRPCRRPAERRRAEGRFLGKGGGCDEGGTRRGEPREQVAGRHDGCRSRVQNDRASPRVKKLAQFGQHDVTVLEAHDVEVCGYTEDTLPMHQTLAPEIRESLLGRWEPSVALWGVSFFPGRVTWISSLIHDGTHGQTSE